MKKHAIVKPGSIVVVRTGQSHVAVDGLVTKQDPRDGSVMVRTERCPTKAEIERGQYDHWVKTPKRYQLTEVLKIKHPPAA